MNKLNYANAAALIADYQAGAKFEVNYSGRVRPVTDIVPGSYIQDTARVYMEQGSLIEFYANGTHRDYPSWTLVKTADAPKAAEPSLIYPLPFKTFDELVEAFEAGTEFVVERGSKYVRGVTYKVTSLTRARAGVRVVCADYSAGGWGGFDESGNHYAGVSTLKVRGEIKRHPLVEKVQAAAVSAEAPLLKRFVLGEDFHCPKTGENLHSVVFVKGVLRVYMVDAATGKLCYSTNYKHDGVHKFHADRSLVPGKYVKPVAPAPKTIKATIYKHAYNGSLFVIREGEVLPEIRGINNAKVVGTTEIAE